jgi:hypothetical protein
MADRRHLDRRTFLLGSSAVAGAAVVGQIPAVDTAGTGPEAFEYQLLQSVTAEWPDPIRSFLGVSDWVPPTSESRDRPLDTARVVASRPVEWPAGYKDVRVGLEPSTAVWQGSMYGIPVQLVTPDAPVESYLEINPWLGNSLRSVDLPVPLAGDRWVEGNPTIGGAFDRHWLGHCPETGTVWEVIGLNKHLRTCLGAGVWRDGSWIDGGPVCAGGVALSRILLDRYDPPHRLGLALNDYAGHDGSKTWAFPRVGDVVRLSPAAGARLEALDGPSNTRWSFIRSAVDHGFVIYDRSGMPEPGAGIGWIAGAQWDGNTLADLDIRLGDLELVTAST